MDEQIQELLGEDGAAVYQRVRQELAAGNEKVAAAASVGAALFALHATAWAERESRAAGKTVTAPDYYNSVVIDAKGEVREGALNALSAGVKNADGNVYAQRETASQKDAVRKQYEGTAQWMKAPNGKATNLTEDQWLTVRTPAFKAWFGDWESVARLILPRNAENLNEAEEAARSMVGKELTNDLLGISAVLSNTNIGKMVSASATRKSVNARVHALAVANVDQLFFRATAEYTHKDRNDDKNIKQIHRLFAPFVVDGELFAAKLTVKELVQKKEGNRLYSVESLEIKEASRKWNAAYNTTEGVLTSFPQEAFDLIIAEYLDKVKNCSKIVDENGEPLVVYHATQEEFSVFKPSADGWYGGGIYLTSDPEDTSYTMDDPSWRTMPLFAYICDPMQVKELATQEQLDHAKEEITRVFHGCEMDKEKRAPIEFLVENVAFAGVIPQKTSLWELEKVMTNSYSYAGYEYRSWYDGKIIPQESGAVWYVVPNEWNVKSATHNNGAFSAADSNVYAQRGTELPNDSCEPVAPNRLNQQPNAIIKGVMQDVRDGQRIVSLFESADESTFLHEMAHVFYNDMERLAPRDVETFQDLAAVERWAAWHEGAADEYRGTPWEKEFSAREAAILSARKNGNVQEEKSLIEEWKHERFARGFEVYIKEGKAPTGRLAAIFEKGKKFLRAVYHGFTDSGGRASAEVEAVMAKLISVPEQRSLEQTATQSSTERSFLAEKEALLAQRKKWNPAYTVRTAKKLAEQGFGEKEIAAALQKHAPDIRNLPNTDLRQNAAARIAKSAAGSVRVGQQEQKDIKSR